MRKCIKKKLNGIIKNVIDLNKIKLINVTIENERIVKMDILNKRLLFFKNKSDKKRNPELS